MEAKEKFERRLNLKAPATRKNYRSGLNKFLTMQSLTEDQLVALAEKDLEEVGLSIQESMKVLIDEGKSSSTAQMLYKGVKFFLKSAGFKSFELDRDDKPRMIYRKSRRATKEQIKEFWDGFSANYKARNRAILMFLKDSGLRVSDVARLDVEHYLKAQEITDRDGLGVRKGERFKFFGDFDTLKTGDYAHILIGPEPVAAVEEYLGPRSTGPLFLDGKHGGRMNADAVSEVFRQVKLRRKLKADFTKVSAHSLRRFHYTMLEHLGEEYVYWLEGKATSVYYDQPDKAIEKYVANYDDLRVFGAPDAEAAAIKAETDQRIQELTNRVDELTSLATALIKMSTPLSMDYSGPEEIRMIREQGVRIAGTDAEAKKQRKGAH